MPNATPHKLRRFSQAAAVAGLACIGLAALLPVSAMQKRGWSEEDAKRLAELSSEYHRSNYQSPAEKGLSKQEYQQQREKLLRTTEALDRKLQDAIAGPKKWKSVLLWAGVGLAAAGVAGTRFANAE